MKVCLCRGYIWCLLRRLSGLKLLILRASASGLRLMFSDPIRKGFSDLFYLKLSFQPQVPWTEAGLVPWIHLTPRSRYEDTELIVPPCRDEWYLRRLSFGWCLSIGNLELLFPARLFLLWNLCSSLFLCCTGVLLRIIVVLYFSAREDDSFE